MLLTEFKTLRAGFDENRANIFIGEINWPPKQSTSTELQRTPKGRNGSKASTELNATDKPQVQEDVEGTAEGNRLAGIPSWMGKKRRNLCGAEKNRRRKAKLALAPSVAEPDATGTPGRVKRGRSPDATTKVTPPPKKTMEKTTPIDQNQRGRTFKYVVDESLTHYVIERPMP